MTISRLFRKGSGAELMSIFAASSTAVTTTVASPSTNRCGWPSSFQTFAHLRSHQLERGAFDCAVGDCAHLRERHCVTHRQRLGAHAEREAARQHGEQHGEPQREHERNARLRAAHENGG